MDRRPSRPRIAVVGAGVAGLACAHTLLVERPGLDVTVYEGSRRVGGKLALGEVAGTVVDLGAESMLNRRPEGSDLVRAVGLAESLVFPAVSGAGVWSRRRIRPLPPTVMGVPVGVTAAARAGVLSTAGALRAALEPRLPRLDLCDDAGFGQVVARRLGPEVRDRLVEPLLGGVYAGRSDEISMHAAVPQLVAAVERHGGLLAAARAVASAGAGPTATGPGPTTAAGPGPTTAAEGSSRVPAEPVFAGIRGGLGRLPQALADDVVRRGGSVVLDSMVRGLARQESGWQLRVGPTVATRVESFDAVVLAVPAAPASRLLSDDVAAAALELQAVEYASMAVVTLAYPADQVAGLLAGTGFLVPPVDGRVIKAATYSSQKWAWLAGEVAVLRCSLGRHRDEAVLQRDDHELIEAARIDLREAAGVSVPVLDALVTRWGGALPQYAVGHVDRVRRIRSSVAAVAGLEVCGAAYEGVGIPAVIADGQAAATRVVAAVDPAGTMKA